MRELLEDLERFKRQLKEVKRKDNNKYSLVPRTFLRNAVIASGIAAATIGGVILFEEGRNINFGGNIHYEGDSDTGNLSQQGEENNNAYTVQGGDTLSGIAQDYGLSLEDLLATNPEISNPKIIETGQIINIPEVASYNDSPSNSGDVQTPTNSDTRESLPQKIDDVVGSTKFGNFSVNLELYSREFEKDITFVGLASGTRRIKIKDRNGFEFDVDDENQDNEIDSIYYNVEETTEFAAGTYYLQKGDEGILELRGGGKLEGLVGSRAAPLIPLWNDFQRLFDKVNSHMIETDFYDNPPKDKDYLGDVTRDIIDKMNDGEGRTTNHGGIPEQFYFLYRDFEVEIPGISFTDAFFNYTAPFNLIPKESGLFSLKNGVRKLTYKGRIGSRKIERAREEFGLDTKYLEEGFTLHALATYDIYDYDGDGVIDIIQMRLDPSSIFLVKFNGMENGEGYYYRDRVGNQISNIRTTFEIKDKGAFFDKSVWNDAEDKFSDANNYVAKRGYYKSN